MWNMIKKLTLMLVLFFPMATTGWATTDSDHIPFSVTMTIVKVSCDASVAGSSTVDLGDVPYTIFDGVTGKRSTPTELDIALKNCGNNTSKAIVTFSGAQSGINPDLLQLSSTGSSAATGVGIAVLESDQSTLIPINASSQAYPIDPAQTTNTLKFYLAYQSMTNGVTPGEANATLNFDVSYQ